MVSIATPCVLGGDGRWVGGPPGGIANSNNQASVRKRTLFPPVRASRKLMTGRRIRQLARGGEELSRGNSEGSRITLSEMNPRPELAAVERRPIAGRRLARSRS